MAYEDLLITQPDQGDGEPISDEWMAQVRDNFVELEPWTRDGGTYTPTWTGGSGTGNPGSGGSLDGWYQPIGPVLVYVALRLTIGNSPTLPGSNWSFSLPVGIVLDAGAPTGLAGVCFDNSTSQVWPAAGRRGGIGLHVAAGAGQFQVNNTVPFAWASQDRIELAGVVMIDPS